MSAKAILNNCISVSDLKKDTNGILKNLTEPKFIFVNNKPTAVLISAEDFENREIEFKPAVSPAKILHEYKNTYGEKLPQKNSQKSIQKKTTKITGRSGSK